MTKPVTHAPARAGLATEAARLEAELAKLPDHPASDEIWHRHYRALRRRWKAADRIVDGLVRRGASYRRNSSGAHSLRHLGVSTSCTSGAEGLIRNWITAARRKAGWEDL